MKHATRFSVASMLATAFLSFTSGTVSAQFPPPGPPGPPANPPTVSPYLNLARRGTPTAINYYGLVRPQLAFQNAIGGLQQQMANNQLGLNQATDQGMGLPTTGHVAVFMNTGGYFMSSGTGQRQSGVGGRGAQGRPAGPQGQQYTPPASRGTRGGYGR
jgi:hypothetical protein